MKTLALGLLSAVLAVPLTVGADSVFRCTENGRTVFTDKPDGASCNSVEIEIRQPDPEEIARMQREKEQAAERNQAEREQEHREQLLRAQQAEAEANARLADTQRRLAEQQSRESQAPAPVYQPGSIWPVAPGFGGHPTEPLPTHPAPPAQPSSPAYPYGSERIGVGMGRKSP